MLRGTQEKYEYLGENETKNQTVTTHWSVVQAGSNDEKNWGSKISSDCPFKKRRACLKRYCSVDPNQAVLNGQRIISQYDITDEKMVKHSIEKLDNRSIHNLSKHQPVNINMLIELEPVS